MNSLCLLTLIPAFSHRRVQAVARQCASADQLLQASRAVFTSFLFPSFSGKSQHSTHSRWVLICLSLPWKTVFLAVDSFIFHLNWHLVWRSGTPCLCLSHLFFTTSKACWFTIQEPTEGFSRGEIRYKVQEGGKTILDMLQLLS